MQTIKDKLIACAASPDDAVVSVTLGELRALVELKRFAVLDAGGVLVGQAGLLEAALYKLSRQEIPYGSRVIDLHKRGEVVCSKV